MQKPDTTGGSDRRTSFPYADNWHQSFGPMGQNETSLYRCSHIHLLVSLSTSDGQNSSTNQVCRECETEFLNQKWSHMVGANHMPATDAPCIL